MGEHWISFKIFIQPWPLKHTIFEPQLDWPKYALSSQTQKFMSTTTFSHYLGQKKYRKPRFEKFYAFFHPVQALQRFWFLRTIYLTGKELSGKALAFKHLEFIF